ncbi:MAG TPA: TlyA family RNA methyltransferase [Chloroflexota bacterium]|nr:TlyA family RNA methyltransferase [Chloroflexota bacterium]
MTARSTKRRIRLDVAMVERGLESSRERARRLIMAGEVRVNGQPTHAPSTLVAHDAELEVGKTMPYVGRGGLKLAHALDRFHLDARGRICLDVGASTGGFTDCLLQRGAQRVYALDVGKGQLAWSLRQDPRVVVMEEVNARYLHLARTDSPPGGVGAEPPRTASLPPPTEGGEGGVPERVSLATVDVAFISLRLILPPLAGVLLPEADVVALVKPQFEAGPADVGKKGVVRKPEVHRRVLHEVLAVARGAALAPHGLTASPIRGEAGNVEFLLWLRPAGAAPAGGAFEDEGAIEAALAEAAATAP